MSQQEGAGPLHWAAYNGHEECVKALLVSGVDKDAKDTVRGKAPQALSSSRVAIHEVHTLPHDLPRPELTLQRARHARPAGLLDRAPLRCREGPRRLREGAPPRRRREGSKDDCEAVRAPGRATSLSASARAPASAPPARREHASRSAPWHSVSPRSSGILRCTSPRSTARPTA